MCYGSTKGRDADDEHCSKKSCEHNKTKSSARHTMETRAKPLLHDACPFSMFPQRETSQLLRIDHSLDLTDTPRGREITYIQTVRSTLSAEDLSYLPAYSLAPFAR